jgi:hypothetical protein
LGRKVSLGKSVINPVTSDMPKELKGMSQKGKRMVLAFKRGQTRTKLRREIAGTLPSHVVHSEHGKPVSSPIRAG